MKCIWTMRVECQADNPAPGETGLSVYSTPTDVELTRGEACRVARRMRDDAANNARGATVTVRITRQHATEPTYTTPPKRIAP